MSIQGKVFSFFLNLLPSSVRLGFVSGIIAESSPGKVLAYKALFIDRLRTKIREDYANSPEEYTETKIRGVLEAIYVDYGNGALDLMEALDLTRSEVYDIIKQTLKEVQN